MNDYSYLQPGQRPPMQVRIEPAGLRDFIAALAAYAPPMETALRALPRDVAALRERAGITTQLVRLRDAIDDALRAIERPASDPLPPTPKPTPHIHNHAQ